MDKQQMREIVCRCCELALVRKDIEGDLRESQVVAALDKQSLPTHLWLLLVEQMVDAIREEFGNVRLEVRPSHYFIKWPTVLEINVQWRDSTWGPETFLQCRVEVLHLPGLLLLRQKLYGEKN